jgi:hypothetical protein
MMNSAFHEEALILTQDIIKPVNSGDEMPVKCRANIIVNVITIYISTLRDQISMNFRFHETCEVLKFSLN